MKKDRIYPFKLMMLAIGLTFFSNSLGQAQNQAQSNLQDVQQIVAIVNDRVISLFDLKQRALLLAVTGGQRQFTPEQQQILQNQAMDALIDDVLKQEEAEKFEASIPIEDLEQAFIDYAQRLNLSGEELQEQLKLAGIEKNTLLSQMSGSMAWSSIVQGLLRPLVNVTDDEVMNFIEKMERDKGKDQYRLKEVFILISDNSRKEEVIETAKLVSQRLREGAPFEPMAQQFSQSSTAAVGGDLGWVMSDELSKEFASVVPNMKPGEVSDPIETEDGLYVLKLEDTTKVMELNNSDIAVDLRYILFDKDNIADLNDLNNRMTPTLSQTNTCDLYESIATEFGGQAGEIGLIKLGQVKRELHEHILALEIGAGTSIQEDENGYRSMILCGKDIPEISLPDFDTVLENITQNRLQLVARRHLRDLRRDAIVDYR